MVLSMKSYQITAANALRTVETISLEVDVFNIYELIYFH